MVDQTNVSATPLRTLSPSGQTQGARAPQDKKPPQDGKAAPRGAAKPAVRKSASNYSTVPFWTGMLLSIGWIATVIFVMLNSGGTSSFAGLPLTSWAIGISAIVSPVAMVWMIAAYLQRAADVQSVTEPLRRQLSMIMGESGAAEIRVRRFNAAIKEQLELLRSTKNVGDSELMALIERISAHKIDLEAFEQNSLYQVKEIQDVIHRSMQHIEKLMDDKFAMLRVLDSKLVQSGGEVAQQTEAMREQIATLLRDIESHALLVATSVEKAMDDSKKLSDTARAQETSLLSAAETASSTLQELSGRIDTDIAHFLGRTGLAREEAEKLAAALDTQTRSLDEFSSLLPARIGEAEAVLRGVADRLYASEELAREQAMFLSEKLSAQLENLQDYLDRFSSRVTEADGALSQRRNDLEGLAVRVAGVSDDLAQRIDGHIASLSERADGALKKFADANAVAKKGTDAVAAQLGQTAARYESATRHLEKVSDENGAKLRTLTEDISRQLIQFEALQKASEHAGRDVQTRAGEAVQNMQQVLERLLATRNATQSVGEKLTADLTAAVDNSEKLVARINEAARMSVHALGAATDSLSRQESGIGQQAQNAEAALRDAMEQIQKQAAESEKALRDQSGTLAMLLDDMRGRLDQTDKRLHDFAENAAAPMQEVVDKIEASAAQGTGAVARYGDGMQSQLDRLMKFQDRVGDMGAQVGKMTSETLSAIEDLNKRFEAVRAAQEETSRIAVEQFNAMAEKLKNEVAGLDARALEAAKTLQDAAVQVGKNVVQIQNEAEDSGAKIQIVTTSLQNEAAAIRKALEEQAADIDARLAQAGTHFQTLSQDLKERTESAYALLDRVAEHYNDITREAAASFEERATRLDLTAGEAASKVKALSSAMEANLSLISDGTGRIQANAGAIAASSDKTTERLDQLNSKLSVLQTTAVEGTNAAVDRIVDAADKFKKTHAGLNEAADLSATLIRNAGGTFGEQASRMLDVAHQVETNIANLDRATTTAADRASEVRAAMESHNARLIANLKDSIAQLDAASARLQETSASSILDADRAGARYGEVAAKASQDMDETSKNLLKIADDTQLALGALSADVTKQVSALNLVNEQIGVQHKAMNETTEAHRTQMLDLFDKLGAAHAEASGVAERTIARLDETLVRVQSYLGQLSDHSQTALAKVTTAGDGFCTQANKLIEHARQAETQAQTAMSVTASLQQQAKELRDALHDETERAGDMLTALLSRLNSGGGEMRALSEGACGALTELQAGIARQSEALGETMEAIAARQQTLANALDIQRETLGGLITRLAMAQDDTANAAEKAASRLSDGTTRIVEQIDLIDARAKSSLDSVAQAGEGFAREAAALAEASDKAEGKTRALAEAGEALSRQAQTAEQAIAGRIDALEDKALGLRDTSGTAERALDTLASTITQQAGAIGANLTDITDRQTGLTSALDVQREMLGDMITRLTLAQDETAAAAERSAARLSDSTGQIARQIEGIDSQTQNALAAVRAAGAGLSDEAAAIEDHTQRAEKQIRDMLETTGGLHDQTRSVRESMEKEAAQVIEQVRSVMAQLEATVDQLRHQGGQVQNVVDKSALDLATIAKNAGEALQKQAGTLDALAGKAETDLTNVAEKIRENAKLVQDATVLSGQQGAHLAETAERATTQLLGLVTQMSESDKKTQDITDRATKTLAETRIALENELRTIAELSGRAVEQLMGAGSALAIQSDALRANLASSESALTAAAQNVREEVVQIPNLLDRSTKEIETTAKTFKAQTADISDSMLKVTDRCIFASGAVRDTMLDESRNLTSVVDAAKQTLGQFNEAMQAQIDSIKSGSEGLSDEQKQLVEKASETVAQLSAAGDRLSQIRGETLQTTAKLAHEFETIESRAADTSKRLTAAGDTLSKQVAQLVTMTEKAEDQMGKASQSFREQLERVRTGVSTQIEDINRGLMQITAQLDRTGTSLRSALAGTVVDVEKIAVRFDETSKDTANQLADRTARMRVATEEVSKLLGGFGDQIDVLLDRLSIAGDGIKRHETDLVGHLQQAFSHLGAVAERLEGTRVLSANVSDAAISKLSEISQTVDKQMRGMAEGGQKVASIIQSVAQTYVDQTQKVNGSVLESQDQIRAMSKAMEEMQQRTDRMRVTLKLQGDDLLDSLETVLGKLSGAGDAMDGAASSALQQKAAASLKKMGS